MVKVQFGKVFGNINPHTVLRTLDAVVHGNKLTLSLHHNDETDNRVVYAHIDTKNNRPIKRVAILYFDSNCKVWSILDNGSHFLHATMGLYNGNWYCTLLGESESLPYSINDIINRRINDNDPLIEISTFMRNDSPEWIKLEATELAMAYDYLCRHDISELVDFCTSSLPEVKDIIKPEIPAHTYRDLVNEITTIAKEFGSQQQLRDRISTAVDKYFSIK